MSTVLSAVAFSSRDKESEPSGANFAGMSYRKQNHAHFFWDDLCRALEVSA